MIPPQVYDQLAVVGLLWWCVMLHAIWSCRGALSPLPLSEPVPPQCQRGRCKEPTPFEELRQRPHCAAWAHEATHPQAPPPLRPDPRPAPNRRPCARDTSAPRPAVTLKAGEGWATSALTAIPVGARGASCPGALVTAPCWRRTARSCTGSACPSRCASACSPAGRRAWASVPRPACAKGTPTRGCRGEGQPPSSSRP
jgi:hypothetical protein